MKSENKPRILVCSESTKISSGFGVYNKFLLEGLYKTNRYEIAEFASYGVIGDKEKYNIPWRYYPNAVDPSDSRQKILASSVENHFGKWRFDRVILDYRPDIVIDVRDYWMNSYQLKSPLRKYFHWILMPTIDSYPQQEEWLDTYRNADAIFTYSDWGRDVLLDQTSGNIKYIDTASPCADFGVFHQRSNEEIQKIKKSLGLPINSVIIGTVMRNQKRKLFPELIQTFEKVLDKLHSIDSPNKDCTFLYLHTSYPDAGWDIPNLIKNSAVGNKIFFTYACKACGCINSRRFSGSSRVCDQCHQKTSILPNVSNGIETSNLAKIMSCFDLYIQYSICEGFGMPQIEAGACGVPILTMNYSAMTDIINKLQASAIKIGTFFKELETTAIRTYPDHDDCVDKILQHITTPKQFRLRKGYQTSTLVKENYNWEETINKWINYIDTIDVSVYRELWNCYSANIVPMIDINALPTTNNIYELIYLLNRNYLNKIGLDISDYWVLKQIQLASDGFYISNGETKKFSIKDLIDNINTMIDNNNKAEMARVDPSVLKPEDYINYAKQQ